MTVLQPAPDLGHEFLTGLNDRDRVERLELLDQMMEGQVVLLDALLRHFETSICASILFSTSASWTAHDMQSPRMWSRIATKRSIATKLSFCRSRFLNRLKPPP